MNTETLVKHGERATREYAVPGALLMQEWGATMRYQKYFQVVRVQGARVWLTTPKVEAEGSHDGYTWISAPAPEGAPITAYAKFTLSGLKLCKGPGSKDWKGRANEWICGDHYWDILQAASLNVKEHYYGD